MLKSLNHEDDMHATEHCNLDDLYRRYKTFAFSIAYRMLGSVSDAEDAVQDCFVELQKKELKEIKNMKAYLAKGMTNRCLNILHSAHKKREVYIGEWLPEPLIEDYDLPDRTAERNDTLSYAYLVMLERLTPTERAVFLLREVFDYDYVTISDVLGNSATNCRKIFSRTKRSMHVGSPPTIDTKTVRKTLVERFVSAFENYDIEKMLELLAEDAVLITDGGKNVRAAINPIISRKRVLTLLTSPRAFQMVREWETSIVEINREINIVYTHQGTVKGVFCFELTIERDRFQNLYLILNPEKLDHISSNCAR